MRQIIQIIGRKRGDREKERVRKRGERSCKIGGLTEMEQEEYVSFIIFKMKSLSNIIKVDFFLKIKFDRDFIF